MLKGAKKPRTHGAKLLPKVLDKLKDQRRWVNWSWEPRRQTDGAIKWMKPPRQTCDPDNLARVNDPATWGTYAEAAARCRDKDADGLGYMLLGSGIGAVDLDKCAAWDGGRRKTKIDPWARRLRDEAGDAYCEVTVSGQGLRLLGRATGSELHRRFAVSGKAAVELYRDTPRFITVSGLKLGSCSTLPPLDEFLDHVAARYEDKARAGAGIDYDWVIKHGAEEGERSELFHRVVWHLANEDWPLDEIVEKLSRYPEGIAAKYAGRLRQEVERSYAKWQQQGRISQNDLPTITVAPGQIACMVDQAQAALVEAQLPIFARGGRLVEPVSVEREAADGGRASSIESKNTPRTSTDKSVVPTGSSSTSISTACVKLKNGSNACGLGRTARTIVPKIVAGLPSR